MVGASGSVPHAAARERSPVPGVIAKDAVSLGDDMPALDIVEVGTTRFASFDMLRLKLRFELTHLRIGKCHHLVLTIRTVWGLLSCTPGISTPSLSSPNIVWRSSLAGCGIQ